MAIMIPNFISKEINRGEKTIFKALRDAQGLECYYCLHSTGLARHRRKAYGEADFILIGPLGVFCLEVKGGNVKRDKGVWTIGWGEKTYTSIEGPFKQSQSTIYPLMDELIVRTSVSFKKNILVGWGVCFPDITFTDQSLDWDLNVVCDSRDVDCMFEYVKRLSNHTREREEVAGRIYPKKLSPNIVQKIVSCFSKDFDVVYKIGEMVRDSRRELANLSEEQYRVLQYALDDDNPRVLCPGDAGTGKTLIALEAAHRLSSEGNTVLLLCYNRLLGEHIRLEVKKAEHGFKATSLHKYMRSVIRDGGFLDDLICKERSKISPKDLYGQYYPELFESALLMLMEEGSFKQYDYIIIDEAQDILFSPTIDAIGNLLKGGLNRGKWLMFFDPGLQSELYGRMDLDVLGNLSGRSLTTLRLRENFRNPEPVVNEMCIITGTSKPICRRKLVSKVEYKTCNSPAEQGKKLKSTILSLLSEGAEPESILILSMVDIKKSTVESYLKNWKGANVNIIDHKNLSSDARGSIVAMSISSSKGLENDIVIITDVSPPANDWDRSLLYVGMTRAKTRLIVLAPDAFIEYKYAATIEMGDEN